MPVLHPPNHPPISSWAVVARSSATSPDFTVVDRADGRLMASRWRRRSVHLDEPVRLRDHLLSYCVRGGAVSTVVLDGVVMHSQQQTGSVSFLPAGRSTRWILESSGEMVHVHLYIAAQALADAMQLRFGDAPPPLQPFVNVRDPWFDGYFRMLTAECESLSPGGATPQPLELLERTANLLLRRLIELRPLATRPSSPRVSPLRPRIVRRIEDHIARHLEGEIRLEHLAAIAAMSVDHFVRAFREATGSTPHRHVLQRRLERACELLRDGNDAVALVARRCGFSGPAHFSSTFHDHHGMTPSQYRRRA